MSCRAGVYFNTVNKVDLERDGSGTTDHTKQ
jgi:hypothetical protein